MKEKLISKLLGGFFSSTMWFGFIVMAIQWLSNNTEMLTGLVSVEYQELAGYAIGALIWFFRWITIKPIENKLPTVIQKKLDPLEEALKKDHDEMMKDF